MGKASNKKVARAARAGGRVSTGQPRSFLFPGVVSAVVVLGLVLVIYARDDRLKDDLGGVPQIGDHIHQAISFNACGNFLPDLPVFETPIGIHTHADGVIHIHPFSQLGVGANATLERYLKNARDDGGLEVSVSNSELEYLGQTYEEGDSEACEGVDDPVLRMAYWENVQNADSEAEITTGGFGDRRLTTNGAGLTIYFGDSDDDIPKPPHAPNLTALGAADGSQVPDEEGNTTTTSAADGEGTDGAGEGTDGGGEGAGEGAGTDDQPEGDSTDPADAPADEPATDSP